MRSRFERENIRDDYNIILLHARIYAFIQSVILCRVQYCVFFFSRTFVVGCFRFHDDVDLFVRDYIRIMGRGETRRNKTLNTRWQNLSPVLLLNSSYSNHTSNGSYGSSRDFKFFLFFSTLLASRFRAILYRLYPNLVIGKRHAYATVFYVSKETKITFFTTLVCVVCLIYIYIYLFFDIINIYFFFVIVQTLCIFIVIRV